MPKLPGIGQTATSQTLLGMRELDEQRQDRKQRAREALLNLGLGMGGLAVQGGKIGMSGLDLLQKQEQGTADRSLAEKLKRMEIAGRLKEAQFKAAQKPTVEKDIEDITRSKLTGIKTDRIMASTLLSEDEKVQRIKELNDVLKSGVGAMPSTPTTVGLGQLDRLLENLATPTIAEKYGITGFYPTELSLRELLKSEDPNELLDVLALAREQGLTEAFDILGLENIPKQSATEGLPEGYNYPGPVWEGELETPYDLFNPYSEIPKRPEPKFQIETKPRVDALQLLILKAMREKRMKDITDEMLNRARGM